VANFANVANFIGFTVLSENEPQRKYFFGKPYGFLSGMLFILLAIVFSPLTYEYR
jgi:hypothetical protein